MSSLPASPKPQKPRIRDLGRRARGVFGAGIRTSRRQAGTAVVPTAVPPPGTAETPAAEGHTGVMDPPVSSAPVSSPASASPDASGSLTGDLFIPDPPATRPPQALPARIPYGEWKGPRPRAVGLAFAMILVAGIISLSGGIEASRNPVTELPVNAAVFQRLGVDPGQYATAMQVVTLAAALVVFGIYLLIAVLILEGRNWARVGGSILAAAGLAAAVAAGSGAQVAAVLMAAAAFGLLYIGDCRRYFRPRRSQYLSGD